METPIYELILNDESSVSGVQCVGIVRDPAIEEHFIAMNATSPSPVLNLNEPEYTLTGPFMIPDKLIPRVNEDGSMYQVYYTAETIKKISQKFFKGGFQNNTSHQHYVPLYGNTVVESWIIQDPKTDKSYSLGMEFPKGTWMISVKINDKEYWRNEVISGNTRGFSIEAYLTQVLQTPIKSASIKPNIDIKNNKNMSKNTPIKFGVLEWNVAYPVEGGGTITINSDGTVIGVDSAGNALSPVPDGHYYLENDYCVVTEGGKIAEFYKYGEEYFIPTEMAKKPKTNYKKPKMKAKTQGGLLSLLKKMKGMFSQIQMGDYYLGDGTLITVDDETLSTPVYDANNNEVGTLTITLNEATGEVAPAPEATEVPVLNTKVETTPNEVAILQAKVAELEAKIAGGNVKQIKQSTAPAADVSTKTTASSGNVIEDALANALEKRKSKTK